MSDDRMMDALTAGLEKAEQEYKLTLDKSCYNEIGHLVAEFNNLDFYLKMLFAEILDAPLRRGMLIAENCFIKRRLELCKKLLEVSDIEPILRAEVQKAISSCYEIITERNGIVHGIFCDSNDNEYPLQVLCLRDPTEPKVKKWNKEKLRAEIKRIEKASKKIVSLLVPVATSNAEQRKKILSQQNSKTVEKQE